MFREIPSADLPVCLQTIDSVPKQLYVRCDTGDPVDALASFMARPRVAVVGTRRVTPYGREVTRRLTSELAARGIVIISGLALGVDAIAHEAALDAGGLTLAVLPGGIDRVYPASHFRLARRILDSGGVIVSEYPPGMPSLKQHFVARNRIVSGLCDALLITEAAEHSGTSHTAGFAIEQGRDLLAVPGNITSPASVGTNNLLKKHGAPVTETRDILQALGIWTDDDGQALRQRVRGANGNEQLIIDMIEQGTSEGSELHRRTGLAVERFNHHLTMLEITGKVRALGANHWALG